MPTRESEIVESSTDLGNALFDVLESIEIRREAEVVDMFVEHKTGGDIDEISGRRLVVEKSYGRTALLETRPFDECPHCGSYHYRLKAPLDRYDGWRRCFWVCERCSLKRPLGRKEP